MQKTKGIQSDKCPDEEYKGTGTKEGWGGKGEREAGKTSQVGARAHARLLTLCQMRNCKKDRVPPSLFCASLPLVCNEQVHSFGPKCCPPSNCWGWGEAWRTGSIAINLFCQLRWEEKRLLMERWGLISLLCCLLAAASSCSVCLSSGILPLERTQLLQEAWRKRRKVLAPLPAQFCCATANPPLKPHYLEDRHCPPGGDSSLGISPRKLSLHSAEHRESTTKLPSVGHFPGASYHQESFAHMTPLIPTSLRHLRYVLFAHIADEKTEVQRHEVTLKGYNQVLCTSAAREIHRPHSQL